MSLVISIVDTNPN